MVDHLPEAEADRIKAHLDTCPNCEQRFFDAIRLALLTRMSNEQRTSPVATPLPGDWVA